MNIHFDTLMNLSIKHIFGPASQTINHLTYHSKQVHDGSVFFSIKGENRKTCSGLSTPTSRPIGGATANAAAYMALLDPGDRVLGMRLDHGGHLTHGMKLNFSGKLYDIVAYGVSDRDSRVDMDDLQRIAEETKPRMILGGWSAYPRQLDWARFREIADSVGAYLMVDMAHFAGLVAAGEHPSPVPHADVVTTTIHKTLGGSRGGMIMCREEFAKKINSAVFPGQQGGPLMHVIAGKAVSLKIAATDLFKERQKRTRAGAEAIAEELLAVGVNVLTGGTDVHLVLADLRNSELAGPDAEDRLAQIGITVNRNAVPNDPRPAMITSGLRIGTPALATRGLDVEDFHEIGKVIGEALTGPFDDSEKAALSERTRTLAERYPLYPHLTAPAAV